MSNMNSAKFKINSFPLNFKRLVLNDDNNDVYSDLDVVSADGRLLKFHRVALASSSDLLKSVFLDVEAAATAADCSLMLPGYNVESIRDAFSVICGGSFVASKSNCDALLELLQSLGTDKKIIGSPLKELNVTIVPVKFELESSQLDADRSAHSKTTVAEGINAENAEPNDILNLAFKTAVLGADISENALTSNEKISGHSLSGIPTKSDLSSDAHLSHAATFISAKHDFKQPLPPSKVWPVAVVSRAERLKLRRRRMLVNSRTTANRRRMKRSLFDRLRRDNIGNRVYHYPCSNCGRSVEQAKIITRLKDVTHIPASVCRHCNTSNTAQQLLDARQSRLNERRTMSALEYTCQTCRKVIKGRRNFSMHLFIHTGARPYPCVLCKRRFRTKKHMESHMYTIHSTNKQVLACQICGKEFSRKTNLATHSKTHLADKTHICDFCGRAFGRRDNLVRHMKLQHVCGVGIRGTGASGAAVAPVKHPCDQCPPDAAPEFSSRHALIVHRRNKHNRADQLGLEAEDMDMLDEASAEIIKSGMIDVSNLLFSDIVGADQADDDDELLSTSPGLTVDDGCGDDAMDSELSALPIVFSCEMCSQVFKSLGQLNMHFQVHDVQNPRRPAQRTTKQKPNYQCTVCGKSYAVRTNLKIHLTTHTNEAPFECDVCKQGFRSKGVLKEHAVIHMGEKNHRCETCNAQFKTKGVLQRHRMRHLGKEQRRFACQQCTLSFHTKQHLSRHMRSHTGEKSETCTICDKKFTRAEYRKKHMLTHHSAATDRDHNMTFFYCNICMQKFPDKDSMVLHRDSHFQSEFFSKNNFVVVS